MFLALGPLIRLGTLSCTLSRTSALRHRPFPKSQAPSSHRAPVLPVPLSTLAPLIVCTRSLIGTNEGLTMSHVTVTPVTVTVTHVTYVTCHRPGVTQDCDVSSIRSHISKAMLRSRVCLSLIDYINGVASWINGLWSDSLEEVWNWV